MSVPPQAIQPTEPNALVFETPRGSRATILLLAVLAGLVCFLVACTLAWALAVGVAQMLAVPWPVAIAGGLIAWLIMIRIAWKIVVASLLFRMTLGQDEVEVGQGRLRRKVAYRDVEMIMLPYGKDEHGVRLNSRGGAGFVCLSPHDENRCATVLRQRCVNAVFVDRSGREYLPRGSDRPTLTLRTLYRRCHTLAWVSLVCCVVLAAQAVELGMELFGGARPNLDLGLLRLFVVVVMAVPLVGHFSFRKWRQVRVIKARLFDCGLWDDPNAFSSHS